MCLFVCPRKQEAEEKNVKSLKKKRKKQLFVVFSHTRTAARQITTITYHYDRETERETERQRQRQTETGQRERQTETGQRERQTDRQTDRVRDYKVSYKKYEGLVKMARFYLNELQGSKTFGICITKSI